jgi:hypothetical protein
MAHKAQGCLKSLVRGTTSNGFCGVDVGFAPGHCQYAAGHSVWIAQDTSHGFLSLIATVVFGLPPAWDDYQDVLRN